MSYHRGCVLAMFAVIASCTFPACAAARVFNVGLPRTGTTSFHHAMALLNFSTSHILFNETRYQLMDHMLDYLDEFRLTTDSTLGTLFQCCDGFSDTPVYALIEALRRHYPDAHLVSTWRDKKSWLASMKRNSGAGGLTLLFGLGVLPDNDTSALEAHQSPAHANPLNAVKSLQWPQNRSQIMGLSALEWGKWKSGRNFLGVWNRVYDAHEALINKFNIPKIVLRAPDKDKYEILLAALPRTKVSCQTCVFALSSNLSKNARCRR